MTRIPRGKLWTSTPEPTRRRVLTGLATATTAALAGCLGDGDDAETDDPDDNRTDDRDGNRTDDGDDGDGNGESSSTVPESFEDPEQLREYTRQYIELVATGETDAAAEWADPEVASQLTANSLDNLWGSVVDARQPPESYRTVAYLGTNRGNDVFIAWATIDGDAFQFTIIYSAEGVMTFQVNPVQEWTPPEYVREEAIEEESVALETPLECELGGTLTLPADADGPVPGVVLVHGNGPQERDGVFGPNRPFKELAWGLASNGIAVLRYDKRTFACEVDIADATIDDIVTDDALTALERLRAHDRVDAESTFVAGHSFGGLLTPRIAARDGNLAGTIMLAPGPTRPFGETVVDQMEHLLDIGGVVGPQREQIMAEVEAEAEKMQNLNIGDDEVVRYGGREYHESLQAYDHGKTAAELDVPQLLIQGGNDWQVTVEDDLPSWENAIGDRGDVTITVYEDLNHLLQESEPPLTQAEYAEPGSSVDERVIDDITSFVEDVTGGTGQSLERVPVVS